MSTAKFQKGEEEDRLRRIRITLSSRNVKALEKGMLTKKHLSVPFIPIL